MIARSTLSTKELFLLLFLTMAATSLISGQVVIFDEDFNSYPDGTTMGTDWDASIFGNCDGDINNGTDFFWGVFGGAFTISDADGLNCCDINGNAGGVFGDNGSTLEIGPIDISPYSSFSIDFEFNTSGDFECSYTDFPPFEACPEEDAVPFCQGGHDQAIFSYSIDGGPDIVFGYWCGDMFCYGEPFLCGNVTGSDLTIKVTAGTQSDSEEYTIDNIEVTGYSNPLVTPTANSELDTAIVCDGATLSLSETGGWAATWTWTSPGGTNYGTQNVDIPSVQSGDQGWWTIEATDGSACTITDSVYVEIEAAPTFTVLSDITVCEGLTVDLDTVVDPSNNDLTYTFHSGNPPTPGNQIPQPTSFNSNTTIYVLGTSSNGCSSVEEVNVDVIAIPVTPPISASDDTVCIGEDFQLFYDFPIPIPGLQFSWTGPNGFSSSSEDPTISNPTLANSGTYSLVVSLLGCRSEAAMIDVIVRAGADAPTVTSPQDVCVGSPIILNAQSNPNATYSWTGPNGFSSTEQNPTVTSNATFANAGTYSVTASLGGCQGGSSDIIVNVLDTPSFDLVVLEEIACPGDFNGSISVNINGGTSPFTYDWSDNTFDGLSTLLGIPSGSYTLNLIDANGCSLEKTLFLDEPDPLDIVCFLGQDVSGPGGMDGSFIVDIIGGTPNYTITYDNGNGTSGTLNDATEGANTISDLPSGTYTITVIDANGCEDECSVTINEPGCDLNIDSIELVGEILCFGDSTGALEGFISGGSGNYIILWSSNGDSIGNQLLVNNLPAGSYTLSVEDADNPGCSRTSTFDLEQAEELQFLNCSELQGVSTPGAGDGIGRVIYEGGSPSYNISWNGPQSGTIVPSGDTLDIINLQGGTYTITITDANGCVDSCSFSIQNGNCDLAIDLDTAYFEACPNDSNLVIELSVVNQTIHTLFLWNGDTLNTNFAQNLPKGVYTIIAIDTLSNCSDQVVIDRSYPDIDIECVVFEPPTAQGNMDGVGGLIVRSIAYPYTAEIRGGMFPVIIPDIQRDTLRVNTLSPGSYQIIVTDSLGCMDSCNLIVPDPGCALDIMLDTAYFSGCPSDSSGIIEMLISGGTGNIRYIWNGDTLSINSRTNLSPGDYSIVAFDENNCRDSIEVSLNYEDSLQFECAILTPPTAVGGRNGEGGVIIRSGAYPLSVLIEGFDFTANETGVVSDTIVFNQLDSGWYTITLTDSLGCSDTCQFFMPDGGCPIFSLDSIVTTQLDCNQAFSGSLEAFVSGGSGNYFYDWNVDSLDGMNPISGLASGTYELTVTDLDLNCVVTGNAIIFPGPQINLDLTTETVFCAGDSAQVDIQLIGGLAPYQLDINGSVITLNQSDTTLYLNNGGDYTLIASDSNGCSTTERFSVVERPLAINSITEEICRGETIEIAGVIFDGSRSRDSVILSGMAANGCDSIIEVNLSVEEVTLDYSVIDPNCLEDPVSQIQINNITGAGLFQVSIGGTLFDINNIPTRINGLNPGPTDVFALSSNLCSSDTFNVLLEEANIPIVSIAQVNPIQAGDTVLLEGMTSDSTFTEIVWTPAQSLTCDTCLSTTAYPINTTTYILRITNDEGCEGLAEVTIIVNEQEKAVYIPNIFSPNGDGINDFFTLYSDESVTIRRMLIFDRWGNRIFERNNLAPNVEATGWDGTFRDRELSEGVYVYSIEIIDDMGNVDILQGSITLIR
jgi:gliding motility-associated-like protein